MMLILMVTHAFIVTVNMIVMILMTVVMKENLLAVKLLHDLMIC